MTLLDAEKDLPTASAASYACGGTRNRRNARSAPDAAPEPEAARLP